MRRIFTYLLMAALAVCALSSCYKKYEWSIPLAVNSTALTLPTTGNGYFFMPIYSTVRWEITIQYEEGNTIEWLHPSVTAGQGQYTNVKFNYDKNYFSEPRHATVRIVPVDNAGNVAPIDVSLTQKAGN